ncbi:MAG TPA: YajQ family cyclic di-GMP-binding protein [Candidatus Binatia bacterium]|nr:YajQ family cyclic di-GMP-binding protein [Candidatus Binatia bacterium]
MPSFDVVSKINWHEVDNALGQAVKEVGQRFDFKNSDTKIELVEQEAFQIESSDDFHVKASLEVLEGKLAKRGVSLGVLDRGPIEPAGGARARQKIKLKAGIDTETAKKIVKDVKNTKMKVQVAIQGDSLRVSGKNRDDLQECIGFLKKNDYGQPLQFENFRD